MDMKIWLSWILLPTTNHWLLLWYDKKDQRLRIWSITVQILSIKKLFFRVKSFEWKNYRQNMGNVQNINNCNISTESSSSPWISWHNKKLSYMFYLTIQISNISVWIYFVCIYSMMSYSQEPIENIRQMFWREWWKVEVHDNVIKWKYVPRYWPLVRRIHRSSVKSPHRGHWRGVLMFSLIYGWINGWVKNGEAGDLRRHGDHFDVIIMKNSRLLINLYHIFHDFAVPNAVVFILLYLWYIDCSHSQKFYS